MNIINKETKLRTAPAHYLIIGGIFGGVFVVTAIVAIIKEPVLWFPNSLVGIVLAAFMVHFYSTKLVLNAAQVHYRSFLVIKCVPLVDIVNARLASSFSRNKPFARLVLTIRKGSKEPEIVINMGLFDPAESRKWLELLHAALNEAQGEGKAPYISRCPRVSPPS